MNLKILLVLCVLLFSSITKASEYTLYFVNFACPVCGKFAQEKGVLGKNERILPLPEQVAPVGEGQKILVGKNYMRAYYVLTKYRPEYEKKLRVALFRARASSVKDADLPEWLDIFMPVIDWKKFLSNPVVEGERYRRLHKTIKLFEKASDYLGDGVVGFPIIAVLNEKGEILTVKHGEGSWKQ